MTAHHWQMRAAQGARRVWRNVRGSLAENMVSAHSRGGLLLRTAVDLIAVNVGLLFGYMGTVLLHMARNGSVRTEWAIDLLGANALKSVPLFSAVMLLSFIFFGLYSRVPRCRLLCRLWVSFRAVLLGFAAYVVVVYLTRGSLPRSSAIVGWGFASLFVLASRLARSIFRMHYVVTPSTGPIDDNVRSVLIIGGAGYIGSSLVRDLLDANYNVRVLDLLLYGDQSISDLYRVPHFDFIHGDFRNVESVVRSLRGMDAVVHLGAIVGDAACAVDDNVPVDVNTNAVRMIREACRGTGIRRFLFASTCSVYGKQEGLIDERSTLVPVSTYAETKVLAERAVAELADDEFRPVILRLATVFGQSYRMRFDLVANLFAAQAASEGHIRVMGGDQWRPFIHVRDVSRAFRKCLAAPLDAVGGQVFNAGGWNVTIRQLADAVVSAVPGTKVLLDGTAGDTRSYRVSFNKIRSSVGFECTVTLEEGIREIAQSVGEGLFSSFRDAQYNNVKALSTGASALLHRRDLEVKAEPALAVP